MGNSWNRDQTIFRASSISMRVPTDQRLEAEPKIESVRKLNQPTPAKEPSEEPALSPSTAPEPFCGFQIFGEAECTDGVDIIQLQVDLEAQRPTTSAAVGSGLPPSEVDILLRDGFPRLETVLTRSRRSKHSLNYSRVVSRMRRLQVLTEEVTKVRGPRIPPK